jgi:type 1 fimbriae regulatory protein FimB/type 1 fimbriae regulatory protein FimE
MREHLIPAEVDRLIAAARKRRYGTRDEALLQLMYGHGLRVAEACELKWSQLDLDHGIIHIVRKKHGFGGDHHLRGVEQRVLRKLKREGPHAGEFVFASERGGPLKPRGVQMLFDRIAKDAGLGELNLHPHVLRHSCGYALSDRGTDLRVIQDYLGHKEIRHTMRYVALSPRRFEGLWDD